MITSNQEEMLHFNGVNGTTGKYSLPPISTDDFTKLVVERELLPEDKQAGKYYEAFLEKGDYAPADDRDPRKLDEVGWGVLFAEDEDPAVVEALRPLCELRRRQAGEYYYEYRGQQEDRRRGYAPGETKIDFLESRGAEPFGPADPENAPYYLLIVGDPRKIPFAFQYELDVQYAVGRIQFDNPEEYARYASNLVQAERLKPKLPRQATFFGVEHDFATGLSARHLVEPLAQEMEQRVRRDGLAWELDAPLLGADATKPRLCSLLNGAAPPSFLFTASHGIHFELDDPRLPHFQGALLCPDDPAAMHDFRDEQHYVSAADLSSAANLLGSMTFHFACYSAGSPRRNNFLIAGDLERPAQIAPAPFVARLPRRLLLQGALAVVGHIERAWECSISYSRDNREHNKHLATYRSTLRRLLAGYPVGSALEFFDQKYGELSTALTRGIEQRQLKLPGAPNTSKLLRLWLANNDARNYIIVGDPAVRFAAASGPE